LFIDVLSLIVIIEEKAQLWDLVFTIRNTLVCISSLIQYIIGVEWVYTWN